VRVAGAAHGETARAGQRAAACDIQSAGQRTATRPGKRASECAAARAAPRAAPYATPCAGERADERADARAGGLGALNQADGQRLAVLPIADVWWPHATLAIALANVVLATQARAAARAAQALAARCRALLL
jgi:hypothetical protein